MKRKVRLICLALCLLLAFTGCAAKTEEAPAPEAAAPETPKIEFPTKPIEMVVGFSAGGGTHLAAELLSPNAQDYLGQPIQVSPKPGAGGSIGATYVANANADGYTLLYATMSLPISLYMSEVEFKQEDFIGIALASEVAPMLVVKSDAPYNDAKELVEWVNANPGEFSWAHPGVGSTLHVTGANMLNAMDIIPTSVEVPFSGTNEGIAAVLGGHVGAVVSFAPAVAEQVRAGEMKILAVSSQERVEGYPDVPTFKEQGYNATLTSTRGIFAKSDTPQEVIDILEKAFADIINSPEYAERGIALGEPPVYANSEDFTKMYEDQCNMIGDILKKLDLID